MSTINENIVKKERIAAEEDATDTVAANVTIGDRSSVNASTIVSSIIENSVADGSNIMSGLGPQITSRSTPMVIAPIPQITMATSGDSQQTQVTASALQAIAGLLQGAGSTGSSQPGLNITDYISALVTQATAQDVKGRRTEGVGGITLASSAAQNIGSISAQPLPNIASAVEGLFNLTPAMMPQVLNLPTQIKVENSSVVKSDSLPGITVSNSNLVSHEGLPESSTLDEPPGSPQSVVGLEDSSLAKRRRAQISRSRDEKLICLVCGDKALGCNFDAVSCESCKAFFRRNALKDKKGKCLFEGNCKIDVNTRRFCPHCRLEKCFTAGMKKEFILSEDAKRKRAQKKEGKGKDDTGPLSPPATPSSNPATPSAPSTPAPQTPANQATTTTSVALTGVTGLLQAQNAALGLSTPTQLGQTPQQVQAPQIGTVTIPPTASGIQAVIANLTQQTTPATTYTLPANAAPTQITLEIPAGSTESVNLLSLSRFVKTTENFNVPMDSYLVRRLTVEESQMLQELMQIYDLSFTVDLEPLVHITQVDPSLNQLVNQSSITVLRIIKFAKRLEEFVRLPQECQIGILKGCWIHMLLLRSVSAYDNERDLWVTARGEIPTGILKNATGFDRLHDDHVKYCKSIRSIIKDDLTIVVLLIVTALFAPEGPHVITRELVSNIQDKYLVLLKHYLESKYMYGRAAEMFPQLMSKMKELKELAEDHGKYLLDVNPNEIEPIMLEILDLK